MANTLSKNNITDGNAVEAWNVTQSVDAFTGISPYDITISGSLNINEAPITNLTASIISASVGITGSLFGIASTSSYVLADNIFQPFTNITASGDINVTAITASEYIGLPSGLVSGSPQIPSLLPSGVVSSSAQTIANLPSGVVSSSAQTIANLPSGIYSSSLQVLGNITSSGNISSSAASGLEIGSITASSQVEAERFYGAGLFNADDLQSGISVGQNNIEVRDSNTATLIQFSQTRTDIYQDTFAREGLSVFDNLVVTGSITASGAISASQIDFSDGTSQTTAGGGVTSIVAGTNVTISPVGGTGAVTINSSGGGGGGSSITDGTSTLDFDSSNNLQLDTAFLPTADGDYDLGSASLKWRDLYLTDSTIYLGTDNISIVDQKLAFNGDPDLRNNILGNAASATVAQSAGTATTATTATLATTATTALNVTASVSVNGATPTPEKPKLLLFSGTAPNGAFFQTTQFTTELSGKSLGDDCFITVTYMTPPAEPTSLTVDLSTGVITVEDIAGAGGFTFMGHIYYY